MDEMTLKVTTYLLTYLILYYF